MDDDLAGDLDRISALPDDLLHLILARVDNMVTVTRTAVLSRRWRHVWVHAKSLKFKARDLGEEKLTVPGYFAGFVDWVLARRGDAGTESIEIHFAGKSSASPEQVNQWLRYAGRCVVKSFDVYIPLRESLTDLDAVIEFPSHCRADTIWLSLSKKHILRLPSSAAARYEALTELCLYSARFAGEASGEGRTLGDLVTSCCPRLRKLSIISPVGLPQLVLRAEELQTLSIDGAWDLRTLDVTAPSLRSVKLGLSFHNPLSFGDDDDDAMSKVARIMAPRLEEISMRNFSNRRPVLDIHGLSSVSRLKGLCLDMYGMYYRNADVGLWLLENCPGVEHVDVWLQDGVAAGGELIDLTSEGARPFASVRSMIVKTGHFLNCSWMVSISSLLMRFPCLRSLRIDNICWADRKSTVPGVLRYGNLDMWKVDWKIALESLEDVVITGFTGAVEELNLVRLLFESSNSIKRMALRPPRIKLGAVMKAKEDDASDDTKMIYLELTKIPCADRGNWHVEEKMFTWTC
ncbi:hypothetical protein ACP70R_000371 [Stipagrostis hirtigluma subsp. patula]